jgi:hypothetical protein
MRSGDLVTARSRTQPHRPTAKMVASNTSQTPGEVVILNRLADIEEDFREYDRTSLT